MIYRRKCKYCGKGFETDVHNKEFCCPEHTYLYKRDTKTPIKTKKCKHCGKEFQTRENRQVFCCDACRKQYGLDKSNKERVKSQKHVQVCIYCGKEYLTFNTHQKYCCNEHKKLHYLELHKVKEKKVKYDYGIKKCKKCGIEFKPNSGRQEYCSECQIILERERSKERYNRNKDKRHLQAKTYRDNRTEEQIKQDKEYQKKYREENKERLKEQEKKYRKKHRDRIQTKQKEYRDEHRNEINAKERERYRSNPEKFKQYQKDYRSNPENKNKIREMQREYRKKRVKEDPNYRMKLKCRDMVRRCIYKNKNWKKSADILGYSPKEIKEYIESLWEPWMNWDNYGIKYVGWEIDHIKPLASFNFFNEDGSVNYDVVREANALNNLRPLSWEQNNQKSDTWTSKDEEEYQKRKNLTNN